MTSTDLVPHASPGVLSLPEPEQRDILLALGLDMRSPLTKALLLVAERYDLDPLLKQIQVIKQNVYITHAGLLHIAHVSAKLDGIVVEDEWDDKDWYRAKVSVYRKDMSHPFTFQGKFRKSKVRADGATGEEMALKNAERSALRRAFDVTAPTMDDSGQDMDDIPPGNDIDLPMDKPALPSADNNALPITQGTPPTESAMPAPTPVPVGADDPKPAPKAAAPATPSAPAASAAAAPANGVKVPADATKVIDPVSGEVMYLSQGGHIINTKTGGEVLAATPEQQALQARAREIAAAANEAPAKPAPAKRVAKATKKVPAEPTYTDEEIKRGQSIHMKAKELEVEESLMRDVVFAVTDKRTRSTREVSHDEADTVKALMVAIASEVIELRYDPAGVLVFDMMDNPLPPDDAEEDIQDAELVAEPVNWKAEANSRGISDGTFLRRARTMAGEMDLDMPGSYQDITDQKLQQAMMEWMEEVSE